MAMRCIRRGVGEGGDQDMGVRGGQGVKQPKEGEQERAHSSARQTLH